MNTSKELQIVSFEQAKALKELGFHWDTDAFYHFDGTADVYYCDDHNTKGFISAPTVALALKWCRDVKGFDCGITHRNLNRFAFWFKKPNEDNYEEWNNYGTYEAAESALLTEIINEFKIKMKTLEFKDICGNLPYGLNCYNSDGYIEEIDEDNIDHLFLGIKLQDEAEDDEWVASKQYKPILYPLSALYKPMPDGTIPLVECAKISMKEYHGWKFDAEKQVAVSDTNLLFDFGEGCSICAFFCIKEGKEIMPVFFQYQLFDYLHSLKIDYRGLIDAGLAVSVYDLEINPYK